MSTKDPGGEYNGRLDRIEDKIDRLSDAMIDLARAEEKLISVEKFNQDVLKKLTEIDDRVDIIEKQSESNANTVKKVNYITMAVVLAVITAVVKVVFAIDLGNGS